MRRTAEDGEALTTERTVVFLMKRTTRPHQNLSLSQTKTVVFLMKRSTTRPRQNLSLPQLKVVEFLIKEGDQAALKLVIAAPPTPGYQR